jgi:hypothetical protein
MHRNRPFILNSSRSLRAATFARHLAPALALALCAVAAPTTHAGDAALSLSTPATTASAPVSTRYGLFDLLDHRSSYGQGVYPEPFLIDDSDLEENEFRLDWFHAKAGASRTDLSTAEVEKGFGVLTLEIEVPYERDTTPDGISQGMDNVDLGARLPIFQYVAADNSWDTTFGVGIEIGIPTQSTVSKNAEFVPKFFNDTRFGDHVTVQSIFGYSTLTGPGDDGGLQTFEYGFLAGFTIHHKELPIPGVESIIPLFEVSGEKEVNHDRSNSVLGNAGIRINLKSIGPIQPRLGVGWVFPMTQDARQDVHAGIYTSLVFEY